MGQLTKKWPFSIAMLNYQRVCSFKILPFGKWFITPVKFPKGTTSRGGDSIRLAAGVRGRNSPWRRAMGRTCSAHNVCTLCTVYTAFFLLKQTHTHIYIYNIIYIYITYTLLILQKHIQPCAPPCRKYQSSMYARGHPHCFTAQAFGKILHGSVEQLLGTAKMIMSVSDPFAADFTRWCPEVRWRPVQEVQEIRVRRLRNRRQRTGKTVRKRSGALRKRCQPLTKGNLN